MYFSTIPKKVKHPEAFLWYDYVWKDQKRLFRNSAPGSRHKDAVPAWRHRESQEEGSSHCETVYTAEGYLSSPAVNRQILESSLQLGFLNRQMVRFYCARRMKWSVY